jgi:hypothetical protein
MINMPCFRRAYIINGLGFNDVHQLYEIADENPVVFAPPITPLAHVTTWL